MASTDARPVPRKNTAFRAYFPIFDADGDLVTGAASLDSEVSIDGAAFSDCTNEATEIGSTGIYYLDLTAGEMNGDAVVVQVKTGTSGAKTTALVFYPEEADDIRATLTASGADAVWDEARSGHTTDGTFGQAFQVVRSGTAQGGGSNTITLDAGASATNNLYAGALVFIVGGTGAGQGNVISSYVGSTKVATCANTWATNPDNTSVFVLYPGAAGVTSAQIASSVWEESTGSHTSAGTTGKALADVLDDTGTSGVVIVDGGITAAKIASDAITAAKIANDAITAAKIATGAIDADAVASDAVTEIQSGLATASALAIVAGYLDTEVAAIKAKTDNLPSDPADASDIAASFTSIAGQLTTIAAYIDTEVAAIKAKTDNLPASPAATGDAMALTSGERSTLAAAILDLADAIETGLTPRQAMRLIAAAIVGKLSGAGTSTEVFRNAVADSKARITATVDSSGNRTAITTDAT